MAEEHSVIAELPDRTPVHLHARVVVRVDDQGRITALDEAADTSSIS